MEENYIPVTFDKSHISTIGTRLYSESLDLVRELVANAYDADATWAKISLLENGLIVEDNGSGMDKEDLKQYFTIGSPYKKLYNVSPRFKRTSSGEFGIGKFAVLSLCDRFELFTKKNEQATTVIFDRTDFEKREGWQVPIIEHKGEYKRSGTKVTLFDLKRRISFGELERRLRQQLPLTEKNFAVFIDGVRLEPRYIPGRRFRLKKSTRFGSIYGEIVVSSLPLPQDLTGVAIKIKGITVRREFLGLEQTHEVGSNKVTGEIRADFLPLTAGRDNFLKNSPEYQEFQKEVDKKVKEIVRVLRRARKRRADERANKTLSEALLMMRRALRKNPEIFLTHDLPLFSTETERAKVMAKAVGAGVFSQKVSKPGKAKKAKLPKEITRRLSKEIRGRVRTVLRDRERVVKRIRIGGMNIVCSLTHLGEDEAESFSEGGVIFINRDHPLFHKVAANEELATFYLVRLIAQEVALLAIPVSAHQAFEWQSRLLTDALK